MSIFSFAFHKFVIIQDFPIISTLEMVTWKKFTIAHYKNGDIVNEKNMCNQFGWFDLLAHIVVQLVKVTDFQVMSSKVSECLQKR